MKVYLVMADLWSVGDLVAKDDSLDLLVGYNARETRAVFDTREAAEKFRDEMATMINEEAEENGFNPIEYVIEEWDVNGSCKSFDI